MLDQDHVGRPSTQRRRFGAVLVLSLGVAACADVDPAYDPFEWSRSVREGIGRVLRDDPGPAPAVDATPPPDEGRPYPNLASVPPKPPRVIARVRDAEIEALAQDRDAAGERARGLVGAATTGGAVLGTVLADPAGTLSDADERLLGRSAERARATGGRIRLFGEARAALMVSDRLVRLGVARDRIDLVPAATDGGRGVEIVVASGPSGR